MIERMMGVVGCLALAGCAQTFYVNASEWTPATSTAVPADGVDRVRLEGRQAHVEVEPGPVDSIRVGLDVGPGRSGPGGRSDDCELPPDYAPLVDIRRYGATRGLSADPPPDDGCVLRWRIVVPRGTGLEVELTVGRVDVGDTGGPLELRVGTGDVEAVASVGPVEASTTTGSVRIRFVGDAHGRVDLRTDVGSALLFLEGRRVRGRGSAGPGDRVRMDGGEASRIVLRSGVGDVELRIGG